MPDPTTARYFWKHAVMITADCYFRISQHLLDLGYEGRLVNLRMCFASQKAAGLAVRKVL